MPTNRSTWPEEPGSVDAVRASVGAAYLARDDINLASIVDGRRLEIRLRAVECDREAAAIAVGDERAKGPLDAVVGPHCSDTCQSTGFVTASFKIPQISYSCRSNEMSDKTVYPLVRHSTARHSHAHVQMALQRALILSSHSCPHFDLAL